ncbi:MAG: hypothetical protein NVSMB9_30760 [Isosphaeraceae bacterium]
MSRLVLLLVFAAFIAFRLPPILCQPGGTDEEWYAIPGLMIAREGMPRVPYARATDAGSVFLGAERLLFAMPPLSFYAQAPFFLFLKPTYATARLASLASACLAIFLVYAIGRSLWGDRASGLWSAGIYSVCRLVYFPAMIARPDMVCGTLGLAAVWSMARWGRERRRRWLALAGVFLGLAGLTHPFAIVFAWQLGIWAAFAPGPARARLGRSVGLTAAALGTFSVWLILILREPVLFRLQFLGNIIKPAGHGLVYRLLFPWPEMARQFPLVIERAGLLQAAFLSASLTVITGLAWRRRDRVLGLLAALGWSSVYLLIASQGDHPLQGYWCYPVAFFALAAGWCVAHCVSRCGVRTGPVLPSVVAICLLAAVFLPGGGLRATFACLRNWNKVEYHPHEFTRAMLFGLPADARLTVGTEYALDAYGLHRHVLLGIRHPDYFDATRYDYDAAILGRAGLKEGLDRALNGRVLRTFGDESDPFACHAVLLVPAPGTDRTDARAAR